MSWLGRYALGDHVPVLVQTKASGGDPAWPDDCPRLRIYNGAAVVVYDKKVPVIDRPVREGLFLATVFLGDAFLEGHYTALATWAMTSAARAATYSWEIMPGGHEDGAVTAAHWFARPHANILVQSCERGVIVKGTNPRLQ